MRKNRKIDCVMNDADSSRILWDKSSFNNHYFNFINRQFLLVTNDTSDVQLFDYYNVTGDCEA